MRYLRTLSNAILAAVLGTCYVLVLFLQLNPRLPVDPLRLVPLVTSVGLFYAVHLTAVFYVMLVLRQLVARTLFSPAWISVTVQAWLGALAAAVGSTLMWTNLRTFGIVLPPETTAAMTNGALVLALSAALFAAAALGRRRTGARGRWGWAAAVTLVAGLSVAVPIVLRGPGRLPPLEARPLDAMLDMPAVEIERVPRVTIIAIDGGSLDLITSATAEGRLPNFGRMLDAGAVLHLATLHPTSAEAVWSAVATGKLPQKNGVRSAGVYHLANAVETLRLLPDYCFANRLMRFGFLVEEPHTSAAIRTRPFWSILSLQGVTVGVLNWPLTYPAPVVRGYVVSNMYSRLALTTSAFDDPSMLYPPDLGEETLPIMQMAAADPAAIIPVHARDPLAERHQLPGRTDVVYDRLARTLAMTRPTQVTAIRYQSLDAIGHYFLRYAEPSSFGDVTDAERADLGQVLESHYAPIDEAIGRSIAAIGPADLLLVVSGFGMEPLSFGKRLLERVIGDRDISGTHETAPDGFLMAYGASVAKGPLRRASVLDVVPTLLYFLGLPIGRDMDGYARTDLFQASFTEERPMTFIPTYDR